MYRFRTIFFQLFFIFVAILVAGVPVNSLEYVSGYAPVVPDELKAYADLVGGGKTFSGILLDEEWAAIQTNRVQGALSVDSVNIHDLPNQASQVNFEKVYNHAKQALGLKLYHLTQKLNQPDYIKNRGSLSTNLIQFNGETCWIMGYNTKNPSQPNFAESTLTINRSSPLQQVLLGPYAVSVPAVTSDYQLQGSNQTTPIGDMGSPVFVETGSGFALLGFLKDAQGNVFLDFTNHLSRAKTEYESVKDTLVSSFPLVKEAIVHPGISRRGALIGGRWVLTSANHYERLNRTDYKVKIKNQVFPVVKVHPVGIGLVLLELQNNVSGVSPVNRLYVPDLAVLDQKELVVTRFVLGKTKASEPLGFGYDNQNRELNLGIVDAEGYKLLNPVSLAPGRKFEIGSSGDTLSVSSDLFSFSKSALLHGGNGFYIGDSSIGNDLYLVGMVGMTHQGSSTKKNLLFTDEIHKKIEEITGIQALEYPSLVKKSFLAPQSNTTSSTVPSGKQQPSAASSSASQDTPKGNVSTPQKPDTKKEPPVFDASAAQGTLIDPSWIYVPADIPAATSKILFEGSELEINDYGLRKFQTNATLVPLKTLQLHVALKPLGQVLSIAPEVKQWMINQIIAFALEGSAVSSAGHAAQSVPSPLLRFLEPWASESGVSQRGKSSIWITPMHGFDLKYDLNALGSLSSKGYSKKEVVSSLQEIHKNVHLYYSQTAHLDQPLFNRLRSNPAEFKLPASSGVYVFNPEGKLEKVGTVSQVSGNLSFSITEQLIDPAQVFFIQINGYPYAVGVLYNDSNSARASLFDTAFNNKIDNLIISDVLQ